MKKVIVTLIALVLLSAALAQAKPLIYGSEKPLGGVPSLDAFHCQPLNPYWNVHQSSTGFSSEFADDIPLEYLGTEIHQVSLYVGEFYGDWIDPDGIILNFYHSECMPSLDPDQSFFFAWDDIEKEVVYDSSWRVYLVQLVLPESVMVLNEMTMGAVVDNSWGTEEPFCGVGVTDYDDVYGACHGVVDAVDWGYPRWTYSSHYTGMGMDLAFCLETGPVAVVPARWDALKANYR
ncbi:MAG: hypothetical protein GY780_12705 [bacterium]|nr:hypothetical protein [bacterium]